MYRLSFKGRKFMYLATIPRRMYVDSLIHVLLMFLWVWMKEKTLGIVVTSMWLMLDRIGEDQVVVGLGIRCFSKRKSRRKNPATVSRP